MISTCAWRDHSESDRRKALDVIDLFREKSTRDELGIGTVRDALSDILFPGISTIQTRARYFFFIPWIYLDLEARKTKSADVARLARKREVQLIHELLESDDTEGVIGKEARAGLLRLPSSVYWVGLGVFGIRRFQGSQEQYHRSLDRFYREQRARRLSVEEDSQSIGKRSNWHEALPNAPEEFPRGASFALTREEADYLRQQIMAHRPHTFLSFLVDRGRRWEPVSFPWEHPQLQQCSRRIQGQVRHARHFSQVMLGAALLYNLMLAEKRALGSGAGEGPTTALIDHYQERLTEWYETIESDRRDLTEWAGSREAFWNLVLEMNPRIPLPTRRFIDSWIDRVTASPNRTFLLEDTGTRVLIHHRERRLKRSLARLDNPRALELWSGAAGTDPLSYRWSQAQLIVHDVLRGLTRGRD